MQVDVGQLRGLLLQTFMEKHQLDTDRARIERRLVEVNTTATALLSQIAVHDQYEADAAVVEAAKAKAAADAEALARAAPSTPAKPARTMDGDVEQSGAQP